MVAISNGFYRYVCSLTLQLMRTLKILGMVFFIPVANRMGFQDTLIGGPSAYLEQHNLFCARFGRKTTRVKKLVMQ
jgi:hypothetical protein